MTTDWSVQVFSDGEECPLDEWLRTLSPNVATVVLLAARNILGSLGLDACKTEWAKPLGDGLWEFRIRHDPRTLARRSGQPKPEAGTPDGELLLRVFFTTRPGYVLLLLGGYNKGARPSRSAQDRAIKLARELKRRADLQQKRSGS